MWWRDLPTTNFGSEDMEERLAALILAGRKRATVWDAREGNSTEPGKQWVVTVHGRPVGVIETIDIQTRRFNEIDADFAAVEGEGDGSLEYWRAGHKAFFRDQGHFSDDMLLWCETFRLIEVIDHGLLGAADVHIAWEEAAARALRAP